MQIYTSIISVRVSTLLVASSNISMEGLAKIARAMAKICDFLSANISTKLWINHKWLDTLGLKEPTTTDELYEILKAFKEKDPNGNGREDEVSLTAPGFSIAAFEGAWSLGNRGGMHPMVDVDESTVELGFIPIDPKCKEMLEYIRKLYAEKLLDPEIFTMDSPRFI